LPAAPAKTGYTFTGWEVKNGDETVTVTETDGTYTFTMPDADVTATAIWELNKPVANYVYGNEDSDKVAIDFTALTATENIYSVIVADVPNTVTTPTGTFFNGYLVTATLIDGSTSEGLYMPGETLDIAMASTVNITAVWQRLIVPVENEVTLVAPWATTATATLNKNDSVRIVADIQGGTDVFRGFLLDVQLNDDYYRFRTDGYIFTFNEKNSNDHLADLNTTISGFNSETYLALFANNAVVTQEAILTVENTTLTVVINSYAASDLSTPAHAVTYVTQISDSLDSRTVSIWADQVTATNAKVYTNLHYSPTQTASETNPITIGADNAGANTTAWVSTVRKGEKLILTGTQTSTGDNAWLMTGVSLFTKAQSAYFRGDNWVDGSTEAAGIHTVGIENWTISKGFSATGFDNAEDPWTELCALNRNCNLSLTVDWTTDSEIKVIISVAAGDKTYTDTFTITATEGELNDFYNLSVGYNASTASITSLVRSTNHAD
ncbi:MAG: hypothetical protein K2H43_00705, partial [Clostridia bacterium]|nr:hypothetical protein [Clostridia bacterium]